MSKKITVYSTATCPYCSMLKSFLQEKNIEFTNIDLGKQPDKIQEMTDKSGQKGVPVVDIEGKIIVGFDKEELSKELEL